MYKCDDCQTWHNGGHICMTMPRVTVRPIMPSCNNCGEAVQDGEHVCPTDPAAFDNLNKIILTLPTNSQERKDYPLYSGCIKYFPAALVGIAKLSKIGNDKHNPGQELHHNRDKSNDHADCIIRHLIDLTDLLNANAAKEQILIEVSSIAWRALALSQELHEKYGAPKAPAARSSIT